LAELEKLNDKLEALQELLFAEHKHKVLIVLQAMDTGGKDGAIRRVFDGVNPAGVRVASFKAPTAEELDHDYLWRIHRQVPGKGEMVIFNRSHYEDVLVVRVHNYVPPEVWKKRFDQINEFEQMLAESGTTILKFYLHINKDEQKERLQARLDDPTKRWKFRLGDLEERKLWDNYMEAYEDVLSKTSTEYAPWYIVPANRKWYRDLVISSILVKTLEDLKMKYPESEENLDGVVIE
jgi:PPK2 family polyphosphate:nucleotide phosphotransferase